METTQDPGFIFLINPEGAHDCMQLSSISTVTPSLQIGKKTISVLIHAQNLANLYNFSYSTCMHVCMCVCVSMYVCMHACMYACMYRARIKY